MAKEAKYMEQQMYNATIRRDAGTAALLFNLPSNVLVIQLAEDKPNEIKDVFNKLIVTLKKGLFQFNLDDPTDDLYHHISKEYLVQLNCELESVYDELKDFDLLEIED